MNWGSKFWQWVLKVIVTVMLSVILYNQIETSISTFSIQEVLRSLDTNIFRNSILVIILLMPLNWLLETAKWKYLLRDEIELSLIRSLKAVLSGVLFSLFTPNRIGQFIGRIWYIPWKDSGKGIYASLMGSISQNLIHLVTGLGGAFILLNYQIDGLTCGVLLWFLALTTVTTVLFFTINDWIPYLFKQPFYKRIERKWSGLRWYYPIHRNLLISVLMLSFLRWAVFTTQYYFAVKMVGIDLDFPIILAIIATIFLMQTFIPLPPVISFLARGEIAILVWQPFEIETTVVLISTYTLWLLNIVLPSVFGWIFFVVTKYKKR